MLMSVKTLPLGGRVVTITYRNSYVYCYYLTTPGESTKINGVLVDESSTTDDMSRTGGSTNLSKKNTN